MGPILDIVTGWALYGGLTAFVGACAARWLIVPRALPDLPDDAPELERVAARLAFAGALLLLPAMALFFVRQLLEFHDPFVSWSEDAGLLLTGTAWGATWICGAVVSLAALLLSALVLRGRRAVWWPSTGVALALGSFPAFTGHASGAQGLRALTLGADVLHVWAAASWIGGLAFVLYAEWGRRRGASASLLPALVPAFSPLAVVCVAVLVTTGACAAWLHLPDLAALGGSAYGRTLLVKLALAAATFALGLLNWRRLTPRLSSVDGPTALSRAAAAELLLAQTVLVVTALLVRTPPPMG